MSRQLYWTWARQERSGTIRTAGIRPEPASGIAEPEAGVTGCIGRRLRPRCQLRLQLPADFAALVRIAVHIDVEVAGLVSLELIIVELGACRHGPLVVAFLGQGNGYSAILSWCRLVNMRHRAFDALRG